MVDKWGLLGLICAYIAMPMGVGWLYRCENDTHTSLKKCDGDIIPRTHSTAQHNHVYLILINIR